MANMMLSVMESRGIDAYDVEGLELDELPEIEAPQEEGQRTPESEEPSEEGPGEESPRGETPAGEEMHEVEDAKDKTDNKKAGAKLFAIVVPIAAVAGLAAFAGLYMTGRRRKLASGKAANSYLEATSPGPGAEGARAHSLTLMHALSEPLPATNPMNKDLPSQRYSVLESNPLFGHAVPEAGAPVGGAGAPQEA